MFRRQHYICIVCYVLKVWMIDPKIKIGRRTERRGSESRSADMESCGRYEERRARGSGGERRLHNQHGLRKREVEDQNWGSSKGEEQNQRSKGIVYDLGLHLF